MTHLNTIEGRGQELANVCMYAQLLKTVLCVLAIDIQDTCGCFISEVLIRLVRFENIMCVCFYF